MTVLMTPVLPKSYVSSPRLLQTIALEWSLTTMQPPSVVDERLVYPFKYWHEGIQQGIRYNNELYTFFQSYSTNARLKAYEMAYEQAEQGLSVCITVSQTHYSIWLSLRSCHLARDRTLVAVQ